MASHDRLVVPPEIAKPRIPGGSKVLWSHLAGKLMKTPRITIDHAPHVQSQCIVPSLKKPLIRCFLHVYMYIYIHVFITFTVYIYIYI